MPTFAAPSFSGGMPEDELLDQLIRLSRDFNYWTRHLDHDNIDRLYTEYVNIQSENGETVIDGPTLVMRSAGSTTIRLKMGFEPATSDFLFQLFNQSGALAMQLDSTGDITLTGGTIRTNTTGERLEISGNSLITYNSSNNRQGFSWGSTAVAGGKYGDVFFYNDGTPLAAFFNGITQMYILPTTQAAALVIGENGGAFGALSTDPTLVAARGYWFYSGIVEFGSTSTIGFFGSTGVAKDSVANLSTSATLGGAINKLNELIDALQGYGLV